MGQECRRDGWNVACAVVGRKVDRPSRKGVRPKGIGRYTIDGAIRSNQVFFASRHYWSRSRTLLVRPVTDEVVDRGGRGKHDPVETDQPVPRQTLQKSRLFQDSALLNGITESQDAMFADVDPTCESDGHTCKSFIAYHAHMHIAGIKFMSLKQEHTEEPLLASRTRHTSTAPHSRPSYAGCSWHEYTTS